MNRSVVCAFLLAFAATAASAPAAVPAGAQAFAGHWSCRLQQGSAVYLSSIVAVPWGNWIKEDITFPAQAGEPASKGIAFLGYDAGQHRWIYNETDSVGEYFIKKSDDRNVTSSSWTGVYPTTGDATTFHVLSHNRYTIDSHYTQDGKALSFHQVCTRT